MRLCNRCYTIRAMNTETFPGVVCSTLIVCGRTVVDETTKLLSIENVYPELGLRLKKEDVEVLGVAPKYTNIPLDMVFVWKREGQSNDAINEPFKVEFSDPKGTVLAKDIEGTLVMSPEYTQLFSVVRFEKGVPTAGPGVHTVTLHFKGTSTSFPLKIRMFDEEGKEIA